MNQWFHDNLGHFLRALSVRGTEIEKKLVLGYGKHLLQEPDYDSLASYLAWYEKNFLIDRIVNYVQWRGWEVNRVLDIGSGESSLGQGIATVLKTPCLRIDKRNRFSPDLVLDIENIYSRNLLLGNLQDKDLLLFGSLWHCLDEVEVIIKDFSPWNWVVLEPDINDLMFGKAWKEQLDKFGCTPLDSNQIRKIFLDNGKQCQVIPLGSYILVLG